MDTLGLLIAALQGDHLAKAALSDALKEVGQEECAAKLGKYLSLADVVNDWLAEVKRELVEYTGGGAVDDVELDQEYMGATMASIRNFQAVLKYIDEMPDQLVCDGCKCASDDVMKVFDADSWEVIGQYCNLCRRRPERNV